MPVDDYSDDYKKAGKVVLGFPTPGEIEIVGDHDWFSADLTAGITYSIDVEGISTSKGTLSDPHIGLFKDMALGYPVHVDSDNDGGTLFNSRLVFKPATTATYYIDVSSSGLGKAMDSGTYTVTVSPLLTLPTLNVSAAPVLEGDSGSKDLQVTVTLSAPAAWPVTVDYATMDVTATAGGDYVGKPGTLTIHPGQTAGTIAISVIGDKTPEAEETFKIALSNPAGATLFGGATMITGTGRILNDDSASGSPFVLYSGNSASDLVGAVLAPGASVSVTSAGFTGASGSTSFYNGSIKELGIGPGILMTTGDGAPPTLNTRQNYGVDNTRAGDPLLTATIQGILPSAGSTSDAATLTFAFDLKNPLTDSVAFDIVFGSEEFPEASSTTHADIAAIFVNGKNIALFNNSAAQPMSVLNSNIVGGNLINNADGKFGIEYDGVSKKLTVVASGLTPTANQVVIGIADTGDNLYDSGLFVSNLRTLDPLHFDHELNKAFVNVTGDSGDNVIVGTGSDEYIDALSGNDVIIPGGGLNIVRAGVGDDVIYSRYGTNTIDGGEGNDTLCYDAPSSSVAITSSSGALHVSGSPGVSWFSDTVLGVELIKFSDRIIQASQIISQASPVLSIAPVLTDRPEGNSGFVDYTFTVTRTGDTSAGSTVSWRASGAGANPANSADFAGRVLPSGLITFGVGEITKALTVRVAGDAVAEADEGFAVALSSPSGASLGTATAMGIIRNDDAGGPAPAAPTKAFCGGGVFTVQEGAMVFGSTGVDTLRVSGAPGARINANVERVEFDAPLSAFTFTLQGNAVVVARGGAAVATVAIQGDADGTRLAFTDGAADLIQTSATAATFGTATITATAGALATTLSTTDPSTLPGVAPSGAAPTKAFCGGGVFTVQEGAMVFGSADTDTLRVSGAPGARINANVERVEFDAPLSAFTFTLQGTSVAVARGGAAVVTVAIQDDADGTRLAFTDGAADLIQTSATAARLGTATVTAGALTTTLDASDASTLSGGSTRMVSGPGTTDVSAGDVTVVCATGSYTHTLSGFGRGDRIGLPQPFFASWTVVNADPTDQMLQVQADDGNGSVITLTLTGVDPAADAAAWNQQGFLKAFGLTSVF